MSSTLFNNAASCGACYEIKCIKSKEYCKKGHKPVVVTATDLCPPGDTWCSPPHAHFDLSQPAFLKIAEQVAGHVPVKYRRYVHIHIIHPHDPILAIHTKLDRLLFNYSWQRSMQEKGRRKVYNIRKPLLQPGNCHKCWRGRRCWKAGGESWWREEMDTAKTQLGWEMGDRWKADWKSPHIQGHHHGRESLNFSQCRPQVVAVRPDIWRRKLLIKQIRLEIEDRRSSKLKQQNDY